MTKLVLDVDTGTDDAIAIMLAALDPRLELLAVATVAGNASIDYTTENSLRVLQHIGADVPVYRGAPGPLLPSTAVRDHPDAGKTIHGGYLDLPAARTTAPLTNVATALSLDPGLAARIPRLVLRGRPADADLSLSHHGRLVAFACELDLRRGAPAVSP